MLAGHLRLQRVDVARKNGWGTWIRTKINGVRVRCSTVELSPNGLLRRPRARRRSGGVNSGGEGGLQPPLWADLGRIESSPGALWRVRPVLRSCPALNSPRWAMAPREEPSGKHDSKALAPLRGRVPSGATFQPPMAKRQCVIPNRRALERTSPPPSFKRARWPSARKRAASARDHAAGLACGQRRRTSRFPAKARTRPRMAGHVHW